MSIKDYNKNSVSDCFNDRTSTFNTTEKLQNLISQLHSALPVMEAEFKDLESRQNVTPNNVFPIKMQALSTLYNATNVLYEWYVEKAKK